MLLDTHFHETHCFRAVRGEDDRAHLIGLAFEETPERNLPDVEGTLWLDGGTGELREVEYRYANLPNGVRSESIGGRTDFVRMPSGAWMVEQWRIQLPIFDDRRRRRRPGLAGFHDIGGAVLEVMTLDGEKGYEASGLVSIRGSVLDSTRVAGVLNDAVAIVGTDHGAPVDKTNQFHVRALLDGTYEVTTSRLEWLGYQPGRIERTFTPGDTVVVDLVIPPLDTVHRYLCPQSDPAANLAIHDDVRTPGDSLADDASITARWEPGVERKLETDESGRYVLSDLPSDRQISLTAAYEDLGPSPSKHYSRVVTS